HVDEIDHRSTDDPVDEVARGTSDDQREADAREYLMMRQAGRVAASRNDRPHGDGGDYQRLEWKRGGVQDAERRAGVPDVREINQSRYDRDAGVQRQHLADRHFRELIEHDDRDRQPD